MFVAAAHAREYCHARWSVTAHSEHIPHLPSCARSGTSMAHGPTRHCSTASVPRIRSISRSSTATRASTIAALDDAAARYAGVLWARGVRPGAIVVWQLPNWWEAVAFCWAVWRCGAIASPITPTLRAREVGFILEQTGARLIAVPHEFRGTDYAALVREAGARRRRPARTRWHRSPACRRATRRCGCGRRRRRDPVDVGHDG